MFLEPEIITREVSAPQSPIQYIHEVLVPELCIMLVQEDTDRELAYSEAQQIMEDSNAFGLHLFPI
jgi:hypothetical protein